MANVANMVDVNTSVYDPDALSVPATLVDAACLPRRFIVSPLNVVGVADNRPRAGQLWPRGDGQSYGA